MNKKGIIGYLLNLKVLFWDFRGFILILISKYSYLFYYFCISDSIVLFRREQKNIHMNRFSYIEAFKPK